MPSFGRSRTPSRQAIARSRSRASISARTGAISTTATSLTALVRVLAEWDADVLFRISSLEPMDCTAEIVDLIVDRRRGWRRTFICRCSTASDEMLRAMRRPYTASCLRDARVDRIRARMPHASIGSDVIVGFPGESSAHFTETEIVLRDLPLTHLTCLPLLGSPGHRRDRARRARSMVPSSAIVAGACARSVTKWPRDSEQSQRGTTRRALTVDDGWSAVTDNYLKVKLDRRHSRNEWVDVRVD